MTQRCGTCEHWGGADDKDYGLCRWPRPFWLAQEIHILHHDQGQATQRDQGQICPTYSPKPKETTYDHMAR